MAELDRLEVQVEAQASVANRQLDLLISKLNKVSNTMAGMNISSGMGSQTRGIASGMSALVIGSNSSSSSIKRLTSSLVSYTSKLYGANNRTRSLSSTFGSFYASFFPIIRGFKALGRAVESSMDYIETFNYFNVTMDKIGQEFSDQYDKFGYDSAESYADSFSSRLNDLTKKMTGYQVGDDGMLSATSEMNLGLDPNAIMNYQASIGAITNSVGLVGETSVNTSKALTMLAADMSSFKNVDLSTVMTNMQSGLIGQSRALYKYGIDITNATLQTYAYKYGLTTAISEMTQADKMQLRLLAILDQSRVAWGDQANTINSVANQYRIFRQQISNVARTIGMLLIPIAQAVLPVINGMLMALGRLFSVIGPMIYGADRWKQIMDGISSGYGGIDASGIADDTEDVADSAGDVGSNLDKAGKSAKKLQKTILGFDQINKLNDNSEDSSSGSSGSGSSGGISAGGIDLSNEIGAMLADYETVWNAAFERSVNEAQAYANKISAVFSNMWYMIKNGQYERLGVYIGNGVDLVFEKINSVFNWAKMGPTITEFVDGYTRTINSLVTRVSWDKIGKTFGDGLNVVTNTIYLWYSSIDWVGIGNGVADGMNGMVNSIDWLMLGRAVGSWIMKIPNMIYGFVTTLNWSGIGTGIGNALNGALMEFDGTIIAGGINGIVHGILDALKAFIKTVDWGEVAKAVGDVLGSLDWGALAGIGLALGAVKLIGAFGGVVSTHIGENIKDLVGNKIDDAIVAIAPKMKDFFGMFSPKGKVFEGLKKLGPSILDSLTNLPSRISSIVGGIPIALKGLPASIAGIGKNIGNFFLTGLDGGFSATGLKAIAGKATSALSGIVFSPAGILVGITLIVTAIMDLWNTSEEFRDVVKSVFKNVSKTFSREFKSIQKVVGEFVDKLKDFGKAVYSVYETSGLKDLVKIVAELAVVLGGGVLSGAIDILSGAFKGLVKIAGGVLDIFTGIGDIFSGLATLDFDKMCEGFGKIGTGIKDGIIGGLLSIGEGIFNAIGDFFNMVIDAICAVFGIHSPATTMEPYGENILLGIVQGFTGAFGALGEAVLALPGMILGWIGDAGSWLLDTGKNAIDGLKNGWESVRESGLGKTVAKIGTFVKDKAGDAKSWLKEKGKNAIDGIKNGWETVKESNFGKTVSKIGTYVKDKAGDAKSWLKEKGTGAIDGLKNGWNSVKDSSFLSSVRKIKDDAFSSVGDIKGKLTSKGNDIVKGLKDGFSNNTNTLTRALSNLPNTVKNAIPSLFSVGKSVISGFINGFKSMSIPMPHFSISTSKRKIFGREISMPSFSVKWYATGGLPNTGEMFVARENGIPEMVGRMGNRSAVVNNDQIVSSIAAGVQNAVMESFMAIQGAGGSQESPVVELTIVADTETLYKTVRKGKEKAGRRYEVFVPVT